MTEQTKKSETARLRNRVDIVVRELHEKYPYNEGWRIVSVNNNIIQLDVVLERSTAQSVVAQHTTAQATTKEEHKQDVKEVVENAVEVTETVKEATSKTTKRPTKTTNKDG